MRGDEIIVAVQEERLSRIKRDRTYAARPSLAVEYCLEYAGVKPRHLDMIVSCVQGDRTSADQDITLNPQLRVSANHIPWLCISHHLGHAISAYAISGFPDAAILVVDGLGSPWHDLSLAERSVATGGKDGWEIISVYQASGITVSPVRKQLVPEGKWMERNGVGMNCFGSIGGMYSAVAAQIFGDPMDAGKVMGLAPFGHASFAPEDLLAVQDGLVSFSNQVPRHFPHDDRWPRRQQEYSDLAAAAQNALEFAILEIVNDIKRRSISPRLCYAGGVALNCVLNEIIWRDPGFSDVFVPPFAEDSGPAIGAAFYGSWHLTRCRKPVTIAADGLGRRYSGTEVDRALQAVPGVRVRSADAAESAARAVARLAEGQLGAWFSGRSEFGPRALGHRSILADPRRPDIKKRLNADVKQREHFRPFAPAVMAEHAREWFVVPEGRWDSPFMLRSWKFQEGKAEIVPAVAHVDGSARVQTVQGSAEPGLHELLRLFYAETGVPMVLNTSLNGSRQPIVETPLDAVWAILELGLDFLVIEGRLVGIDPILDLRSLLDLVPVLAASYNLDMAPSGGAMSLVPDSHSAFNFRVTTPWGMCEHRVPVEVVRLLAFIDGKSRGWDILDRLQASHWHTLDEDTLCRELRALRRIGVIDLRMAELAATCAGKPDDLDYPARTLHGWA